MSANTITRRRLLQGAALAGTAGLLVACQPKVVEKVVEKVVKETVIIEGTPKVVEKVVKETVVVEKEAAAPAREPAKVVWWFQWNAPAQMEAFSTIAKNFGEMDNGITVEALQVPTMQDKMLAAVAGGNPPDVGVCCIQYVGFYVRGVFTPLDDYLDASEKIKREDFVPGLFESMVWRGKTYGVPACECGPRFGYIFNIDHLEEAGLDPDNLPQTWDETWDWHTKLTKKDAAGNLEQLFLDPFFGSTTAAALAPNCASLYPTSWGFSPWDGDTMTFNFDNPQMVEAFTWLKKMYDDIGVEKLDAFSQANPGGRYVPTGAMPAGLRTAEFVGYYAPGELHVSAPDTRWVAGWCPRPESRRNVRYQNVGGHPIYIPLASKVRDQAFEFIEYVTSEEAIDIIFKATAWLGGRKAGYDANRPDISHLPSLKWYLESANTADELVAGPVIPNQAFATTQYQRAVSALQYGEKTPEQAAVDLQKEVTEDLAKEFPELLVE
ncbi:MAG: extracellular solute-binding protein [Chloroflexi bacterium]|nr:extracellular solute-binding protein [Chloroflexota bacterium]